MKNTKIINKLLAICTVLFALALLVPFLYVSKFAYPWADDFGYSYASRLAFVRDGSIIGAIAEAFKGLPERYMGWQGTYTSMVLMSLSPAVWNIKLYHLTGVIMLGTMLLAYVVLGKVVLRKLLGMSREVAVIITALVYMVSVECVRGIAEAFTWFNGAVHYTFNNAWSWGYVGLLIYHLYKCNREKSSRIPGKVILCIIAFLVAGGNNVTVLGGVLFNVLLTVIVFVYQHFIADRKSDVDLAFNMFPSLCAYILGAMVNFLAPGNKVRMSEIGGGGNPVMTVVRALEVAVMYIGTRFSFVLLAVVLLIGAMVWYSFAKEKSIDNLDFSFPLPGVVLMLSYGVLAALMTPILYTGDASEELKFAFMQVYYNYYRVENIIWFDFVLLLVLNVVYFLGWLYKKGFKAYRQIVINLIAVAALVLLVIGVKDKIAESEANFITTAAISNIKSGTAEYYGYQMAVNTERLSGEEREVKVMSIAVAPECLYPFDAEDWKDGSKFFYDKDLVEYEDGPYTFRR